MGGLWWLSFCDTDRPEGQQFLGACIVHDGGTGEIGGAVIAAHALGINPGGEVAGLEADPDLVVPDKWINRLLTREECEAFDGEMLATRDPKGAA